MGPMMQRIQGLLGSSLPRMDAFATGIAPLVADLILPRGGLKFGYITRCRDRSLRGPHKFPFSLSPPSHRRNNKDFKWLMTRVPGAGGVALITNRAKTNRQRSADRG
jgi:hypothetical protein